MESHDIFALPSSTFEFLYVGNVFTFGLINAVLKCFRHISVAQRILEGHEVSMCSVLLGVLRGQRSVLPKVIPCASGIVGIL